MVLQIIKSLIKLIGLIAVVYILLAYLAGKLQAHSSREQSVPVHYRQCQIALILIVRRCLQSSVLLFGWWLELKKLSVMRCMDHITKRGKAHAYTNPLALI